MRNKGRSTIGDTLSEAMKLKMEQMVLELQKGADDIIARQLKQPRPPSYPAPTPDKKYVPTISSTVHAPLGTRKLNAPVRVAMKVGGKFNTSQQPRPARAVRVEKSERGFSWWELPSVAAVREVPPNGVSPLDRREFQDIALVGTTKSEESTGLELFANVGLDFGTSSTKVVVRFPFESGEPTIAVPAPAYCRSDSHPYLWQTVLWMRQNGDFLAWPEAGAALLHALKPGVIDRRENNTINLVKWAGVTATNAEAATAYLAYVIRYVRGWLLSYRQNVTRNRRLVWFENVGLPAASLDDIDVVCAYRRIVAAAHLAAVWPGELTVAACRTLLNNPQVLNVSRTPSGAADFGVAVIPETAAEATGFFKSNRATEGAYLMVDVGAMTLDACMFGFQKSNYMLYNAMVRPLGVESYHWFMKEGKPESGFDEQCQRCFWEVVWRAKVDYIPQVPCWKPGGDLPVFLVGGGAKHQPHRKLVDELGPWLRQSAKNSGIRLLDLPVPRGIDLPEKIDEFSRLAVAWGLSYPPDQIGEISARSSIEKVTGLPRRTSKGYVSKDQV